MDDFWNDVRELAASPVASQAEAQSVFDLFSELISQEIVGLDADACQRCCLAMVHSKAYQSDLQHSHDQLQSLLLTTDPLHKHEVEFVATVILNDPEFMHKLGQDADAMNAVINYIWMFRFTQPRIVDKYMLILVAACIATPLDTSVLQDTISSAFVLFLFRTVCNNDENLTRSSLLVLLALNHQYMLKDMHGPTNKVFWELEQCPQQYSAIGSSLVMRLNRSHDSDEALKVITCKFFYLLFTNKQTADLLYTNDLNVLLGVVIRELNDLPTECIPTREMYLRLLYVMLVHSAIAFNSPEVRSTIVQTLRLILDTARELNLEADQAEMTRLAERCLAVKWLKWSNDETTDEEGPESSDSDESLDALFDEVDLLPATLLSQPTSALSSPTLMPASPPLATASSPSLPSLSPRSSLTLAPLHSHRPPPPPPPPPPVPATSDGPPPPPRSRRAPPPPPPRHMSTESLASEDSQLSIDFVDHLRPPPAPPSRKFLRLEKVRTN